MPTTSDYLTQLQQDREDLVDNLETQGISDLTGDETFTELVPRVLDIQGGSSNLQSKDVTITENGTTNITADSGYDGLSRVNVTTNVQQIPVITNATELILYSKNVFQNFENYLKNIKDNYDVYTNQPITLYSPEGFSYYVIQKRNDNTYRIVWSKHLNIASFHDDTGFCFCGILVSKAGTNVNDKYIIRDDIPYDLEAFKNRAFDFEIQRYTGFPEQVYYQGSYVPNQFYYSNSFNNIQDLIDAITSLDGNITYTSWKSGYAFSGIKDTTYNFAYTNCNVMDYNTGEFLNDKIISHNETILEKTE